jgi:glycerophosphoryl diester phosphodiesterase
MATSPVIAFVGVGKYDTLSVKNLQAQNVYCMLGTMGDMDRKAEQNNGLIYTQVIDNQIDMLATDQPILARKAMERFWQMPSRKKKFFKIVK